MPNDRIRAPSLRTQFARPTRNALLWLICLGLILGFAFQGSRNLWGQDEGRYIDAALQMLDSGDYLTPGYSPDEVNFSKPPTTYWIIAAAMKVGGRNAWAARAPYALAFLLTMLALYGMGKRLMPDKPWLPGLVYACCAFPFATSNIVSTDVFLTLSEAVAMLGFVCAAFGDGPRPDKRYVLLMWLGWGLAFLTKGPPGLMPLLAVIPFIVARDGWRGLSRYFMPSGVILFLVIGGAWYAIVMLRTPGLLHYFLYQEVYNRLFTGAHRRHAGAWGWAMIYLPTLVLGSLPWWFSMARGLRSALSIQQWKMWRSAHAPEFFLGLWFLIPFVVFCLAQSRLPLYMLPLFLPISLMLALELRPHIDLNATRYRVGLLLWVALLLCLKGGAAYLFHPSIDNKLLAQELSKQVSPDRYAAVIFIQNTDQSYTIEEETPWGLRMYLDKPVYGIPLLDPQGGAALCHALQAWPASLVVVDPNTPLVDANTALQACKARNITRTGIWRDRILERVER
jgi:4-amino-4-deoxy-L-arabinose transferase-like glycosyltransferase